MKHIAAWLVGIAGLFASNALPAADAALMARGKYLMEGPVACGNCHFARNEKGEPLLARGLSGGMPFDEPVFKAYAANITPDRETGIGKWTDAQLAKAIREGVRPDKSVIGPPMPIEYYRHLSDRDLAAIIAYLRAQPAVRNDVPKSVFKMPLPASYGPPVKNVVAPPASGNQVRYGEYLANISHCMECHTQRNEKGEPMRDRLGAGGVVFQGPWGKSVSRNLTSHESGLKHWTDAQIEKAIRDGVDRNGHPYRPPMAFAFYKNISDSDMAALIAYLRSLKPRPSAANG